MCLRRSLHLILSLPYLTFSMDASMIVLPEFYGSHFLNKDKYCIPTISDILITAGCARRGRTPCTSPVVLLRIFTVSDVACIIWSMITRKFKDSVIGIDDIRKLQFLVASRVRTIGSLAKSSSSCGPASFSSNV